MKNLLLLFVFASALLLTSCSDDPTTSNPYQGNWNIAFAGDYTGSGSLKIDQDGKFSFNVTLINANYQTFTNTISGSVDDKGNASAKTYYAGDEIGGVSGKFNGNSGSGSWQTAVPTYGTWSASRIN